MIKYLIFFLFFQFCSAFKIVDKRAELNDTTKVTFRLYTRKNPTEFQELFLYDLNGLLLSNYDFTLPTKIYAPGWNNEGAIAEPTKDEYLKRDDCNVFIIYWVDVQEGIANGIIGEVQKTQTAAEYTSAFINFLIENGTPVSSFHLIGHSAGAHLAGGAGAGVVYGKIPRITGLEPATGRWSLNDTTTCLDLSDADFVDIMHTSTASFPEAIGHVDFYVNGALKQPGCETPERSCCSHCRAADLFAESINTPLGFVSLRCDSYDAFQSGACNGNDQELMGDTVSLGARGVFYVDTNGEAPWAMG